MARVLVLACSVAFVGFAGGFGLFADYVSSLSAPDDVEHADAIIVVTGGKSRLEAAVGLLNSGKGKRLLISGVHPTADLDALRTASGGDRRLFRCCVDIDYAALDTIGNAQESAKWLKDHAYSRVIVVTNNYHVPRTLLEMRRMGTDTEFVAYPVVNAPLEHGSWLRNSEVLRVLFTEYAKYLAAVFRGMLPAQDTDGSVKMVNAGAASG